MSRPMRGPRAGARLLWLALSTAVVAIGCAHAQHAPAHLKVERVGGLAGFGGPGSRLQSRGEIDLTTLSPADRQAIDSLFLSPPTDQPQPDAFRYRLTRRTAQGDRTIEVPEDRVPDSVRSAVNDELR